jgi:hypothetical protein
MATSRVSGSKPVVGVYVESGQRRVFAAALDWPGWCRSGRDEASALETLAGYAGRYAPIARAAGEQFPAGDVSLRVRERLEGGATTDFGAPEAVTSHDGRRLTGAEASRQCRLLRAAWSAFDGVVEAAPATLRKGPRGGGRDRDKIVEHLVGAEVGYARKLGLRLRTPDPADGPGLAAHRAAIVDALDRPSDGSPLAPKGWPARYALRRFTWHVLDHLWEIEDRRDPT